ncbi:MAG: TIGR01212 family radical SAM protein [Thermoguttaceae bacterium]
MQPPWKKQGYFYNTLGPALREEFGESVWKVSVDAHFTCPHKSSGGCIFCHEASYSPSRERESLEHNSSSSIAYQLEDGIMRLKYRYKADKFIAYFQPSTNTYAPLEVLRKTYLEAIAHPKVVGIAIGTRPDCLDDTVLDLIAEIASQKWLVLEIGLQTVHDRLLRFLNRGHDYATFCDSVQRAKSRNIRLGTHLILGLPGETDEDRLICAQKIARFEFHSVKLHNLFVVKETKLAELWNAGQVQLPSCEEYAKYVVDFLEWQHPATIIERISGDASDDYLIYPPWTAHRHTARNAIDQEFRKRKSWQGIKFKQE